MKWTLAAVAALAMTPSPAGAGERPLLYDPISLNIGVNCRWQPRCMSQQRSAMKRALYYVAKYRPAQWRVQQCNRNARRAGNRVDWSGFDHCIRNTTLTPVRRTRR